MINKTVIPSFPIPFADNGMCRPAEVDCSLLVRDTGALLPEAPRMVP
jgi:hypothetical protein